MNIPSRITLKFLERWQACFPAKQAFIDLFGASAAFTPKNVRKAREHVDTNGTHVLNPWWLIRRMVDDRVGDRLVNRYYAKKPIHTAPSWNKFAWDWLERQARALQRRKRAQTAQRPSARPKAGTARLDPKRYRPAGRAQGGARPGNGARRRARVA